MAYVPLTPLGAEPDFSDTAAAIQATVRRFATEVPRPGGRQLDRMTPEEVIAPEVSPYGTSTAKFAPLGFGVDGLLALEPVERARTMAILFEELGWGHVGLAILIGAGLIPGHHQRHPGQSFLS